MALISTSEAKQMIPALSSGSTEDTLLTSLISAVGAAMAAWCGYPSASAGAAPTMESATYTRYQDGPGERLLVLDVWPVTSITSIYDSQDRSYRASDQVASGDFTLVEGERGLVELDWDASHGSWSTARRAIKSTYVAGWATVPENLKQAARIAVRARRCRGGRVARPHRHRVHRGAHPARGVHPDADHLTGRRTAPVPR